MCQEAVLWVSSITMTWNPALISKRAIHWQDDICDPRQGVDNDKTTLPTSSDAKLVPDNTTVLNRCWNSATRDSLQSRCNLTPSEDEDFKVTSPLHLGYPASRVWRPRRLNGWLYRACISWRPVLDHDSSLYRERLHSKQIQEFKFRGSCHNTSYTATERWI